MQQYGFEQYIGASGPSEELVEKNNNALVELAKANGLTTKVVDMGDYSNVEMSRNNGRVLASIGYDRWGYCDENGVLDQASWEVLEDYVKTL